ncbi:hypothetical protein B0H13DRAFT_2340165 [Mycena leptocephala]|nr:hypothetical protein B0H13DRAFT_2340165 [Mycena leptocephala]
MAWRASSHQRPRPVVVSHTARRRPRPPVPVQAAAHTHIRRPVAPMSIRPRPLLGFPSMPPDAHAGVPAFIHAGVPCLDLLLINSFSPGVLMNAAANFCISVSQDASFFPFFTSSAYAFYWCRIEIFCPLLYASPSAAPRAPSPPHAAPRRPLPVSAAIRFRSPLQPACSPRHPRADVHLRISLRTPFALTTSPRSRRPTPAGDEPLLGLEDTFLSSPGTTSVFPPPPNATNATQNPPTKPHTFRSCDFAPRSACAAWLMRRAANETSQSKQCCDPPQEPDHLHHVGGHASGNTYLQLSPAPTRIALRAPIHRGAKTLAQLARGDADSKRAASILLGHWPAMRLIFNQYYILRLTTSVWRELPEHGPTDATVPRTAVCLKCSHLTEPECSFAAACRL